MSLWQGVRSNTISKAFVSFHLLDSSFTLHRPREDNIEGNKTQPRSILERPPRLWKMLAGTCYISPCLLGAAVKRTRVEVPAPT
jgi:hypothetical protein